jgi:membrane-associated phospholipid phosphatase
MEGRAVGTTHRGGGATERTKLLVAACLASLLCLALLASLAFGQNACSDLDARLAHHLSAGGGNGFAAMLARLGDPPAQLVLLALACLMALRHRAPARACGAAILVGGAALTSQLLKLGFGDGRFSPVLGWYQIGPNSFPSGHETAVVAMVLAFALVVPGRLRPLVAAVGVLLALAVGWALVALHRHFPSDVLGGVLVALAWYFAVAAVLGSTRVRVRKAAPGPGCHRSRSER